MAEFGRLPGARREWGKLGGRRGPGGLGLVPLGLQDAVGWGPG